HPVLPRDLRIPRGDQPTATARLRDDLGVARHLHGGLGAAATGSGMMAEAFVSARTLEARVEGLYWAPGKGFETEALGKVSLTYEGIPGDRHSGLTRKSGAREPWYPR